MRRKEKTNIVRVEYKIDQSIKAAVWYIFNIVYVYMDNCKLCESVMYQIEVEFIISIIIKLLLSGPKGAYHTITLSFIFQLWYGKTGHWSPGRSSLQELEWLSWDVLRRDHLTQLLRICYDEQNK